MADAPGPVECLHPPALGPELGLYSHASRVALPHGAALVSVAGQLPIDADGQTVGLQIEPQTRQVLANVTAVLAAAGCGWDRVVSLRTYMTRQDDVAGFARARAEAFAELLPAGADPPPNTLVFVAGLLKPDYLIEIDALAVSR